MSGTEQAIVISEEIHVEASLEATFASLLVQMGRQNETPEGQPMPMIIEPRPGGRWYRELGGDNGHLWGHVQSIKRPVLLEMWGPLFISTGATSNLMYRLSESNDGTLHHIPAFARRSGPRRIPPAAWRRDGRFSTSASRKPPKRHRGKEIHMRLDRSDPRGTGAGGTRDTARAWSACPMRTYHGVRIRNRSRSASSRCTSRRFPATSRTLPRSSSWRNRRNSSSRAATSAAELVPALDASLAQARQILAGFDDAVMTGTWRLMSGGRELMALPRAAILRTIMLNHWYHHRGQLLVYLRLHDVPLPSCTGPRRTRVRSSRRRRKPGDSV